MLANTNFLASKNDLNVVVRNSFLFKTLAQLFDHNTKLDRFCYQTWDAK
jgi:hypothetical protein